MAQDVLTQEHTPSLFERLSIIQIVLGLALLLGGGVVGILIVQGNTTQRLSTLETQNEKQDKGLEDIRKEMLSRSDLDALLRELGLIRDDVKEIRAEQLRQAREK